MRTVLIADSDAFQRQLIDMLLAVDNHRVLGFDTGRSVLEYLQAHVPDLVILDYSLPDINGADLCAKMKKVKRLANVPVILVTAAHKLELVRGIATAVRADLVLAKPLGDKHLRENVLELLKGSSKAAPSSSQPEPTITSTALRIDPILEQALANLTHESLRATSHDLNKPLDTSSFTNTLTPVPIDRDEPTPYTLELPSQAKLETQKSHPENLPPLFYEAAKEPLHEVQSDTFQQNANAALESLLGSTEPRSSSPESHLPESHVGSLEDHLGSLELKDTPPGVFEFFDDETGGISEQELLASLQTPLEPSHHDKPLLNPPPFLPESPRSPDASSLEPQPYTLGGTAPSSTPALAASFEETVSDIEAELTSYRAQVQQLSAENERLREALLEMETGEPLATSKSYLDMVEELEMLRRLTDIQVKQMDSLQRQNQKLMEDAQQAQERRRGLFGFLQNKHQS